MQLELTEQEAGTLLQILDQVSVRGIEQKLVIVGLMSKIVEIAQPQPISGSAEAAIPKEAISDEPDPA